MGVKEICCAGCNASGVVWCQECQGKSVRIKPPYCRRCGYPSERSVCKWCRYDTPWFDGARSWASYSGELRFALLRLKAQGEFSLASELAVHLATVFMTSWAIDLVIPIPLHAARLCTRGFNQAQLLAEAFTSLVKLPIAFKALVRVKDTQFQRKLRRSEREQNLRGAFRADKKSLTGMRVLVVDDIFTTGATINSASKAIKAAGGQSVFAITIARSLINRPA